MSRGGLLREITGFRRGNPDFFEYGPPTPGRDRPDDLFSQPAAPAAPTTTRSGCVPPSDRDLYTSARYFDLDTVHAELLCSLCQFPLIEPAKFSGCLHVACSACIDVYRQLHCSNGSMCPVCGVDFGATPLVSDRVLHSLLDKIRVYCPNEACDSVIARGSVRDHLRYCDATVVRCENGGCAVAYVRSEREKHEDECAYKQVECDCGQMFAEALRAHHELSCTLARAVCRDCGESVDASHTCGEGAVRACVNGDVGCKFRGPESRVDEHELECPFEHARAYIERTLMTIKALEHAAQTEGVMGNAPPPPPLPGTQASGSGTAPPPPPLPSGPLTRPRAQPQRRRSFSLLDFHVSDGGGRPGESLFPDTESSGSYSVWEDDDDDWD